MSRCECAATFRKSASRSSTYGHEVGEDDVVEGLVELELLAGRVLEARAPGAASRASSTMPRADVDADARAPGSSAASRSPFAAPDLEHRRARPHDRPRARPRSARGSRAAARPGRSRRWRARRRPPRRRRTVARSCRCGGRVASAAHVRVSRCAARRIGAWSADRRGWRRALRRRLRRRLRRPLQPRLPGRRRHVRELRPRARAARAGSRTTTSSTSTRRARCRSSRCRR